MNAEDEIDAAFRMMSKRPAKPAPMEAPAPAADTEEQNNKLKLAKKERAKASGQIAGLILEDDQMAQMIIESMENEGLRATMIHEVTQMRTTVPLVRIVEQHKAIRKAMKIAVDSKSGVMAIVLMNAQIKLFQIMINLLMDVRQAILETREDFNEVFTDEVREKELCSIDTTIEALRGVGTGEITTPEQMAKLIEAQRTGALQMARDNRNNPYGNLTEPFKPLDEKPTLYSEGKLPVSEEKAIEHLKMLHKLKGATLTQDEIRDLLVVMTDIPISDVTQKANEVWKDLNSEAPKNSNG